MQKFLVYKSSAGSGKTYTLMLVYLSIVLKEPARFRNILAITFTNKAANEIKQRIVSSLKIIIEMQSEPTEGKLVHLIQSLQQRTELPFEELRANAGKVLSLILHNYGDFAVSTIDSFMHRIIRAFSFDLKLAMNFEVEMNTDLLLANTVDALLADVGKNEQLTQVLVKFVRERAEEDESWQIDRDLQSFADNLFNEDAIDFLKPAGEFSADNLDSLRKKLTQFLFDYKEEIVNLATDAMKLIEAHGIDPDLFSRGNTGIYNYFKKLSQGFIKTEVNSYVAKTINDGVWLSAKGQKSAQGQAVLSIADDLLGYFKSIEAVRQKDSGRYELYLNLRRNLYPMAVLGELSNRLQNVKKDLNVVSIAEFNRIISSIVMNEPVPFIYERTGEKYRHYLIDEFQDTSVLQWNNLLPLIDNSLSHGALNMIVGDGKQAIYRFRNGEVEQFVKLPEVDNPSGSEVLSQRSKSLEREYLPSVLDSNFRSKCEIVDFNNSFFNFSSKSFLPEYSQVYEDSAQKSDPLNNGGQVQIEFFDGDKKEFSAYNCRRAYELIDELKDSGYSPGDITILCRSNKDSSQMAAYLNSQGVKVVSSDSLLLRHSPEVNFMMNWLTLMTDPENVIVRSAIAMYLFNHPADSANTLHTNLQKALDISGFYKLLEENGYRVSFINFGQMSLYDTCEELIRIFGLHLKSPVYMQFFLDEILSFTSGKMAGAVEFLEHWEQKKNKLSVVLPLSDDAVQIMTIHKSKGLEFPVVIYAFADDAYKLTKKSAWVNLNDPLLTEMPVAMLKLDKSLEKTDFASLYTKEDQKSRLDLMNMVYVAFTRPAERLYVLTGKIPEKETEKEVRSLTALIVDFLKAAGLFEVSKLRYTFGDSGVVVQESNNVSGSNGLECEFLSSNWQQRLVFAGRAPQIWQSSTPESAQLSGNLLHKALAGIIYPSDLDKTINKLLNEGVIVPEEVQVLRHRLGLVLSHPDVARFFRQEGKIAVETEILAPGGKSYRPDRVVFLQNETHVVDYKAGAPVQSHKGQVLKYASLLEGMGYPRVRAWLVYLNQPVEVIEMVNG